MPIFIPFPSLPSDSIIYKRTAAPITAATILTYPLAATGTAAPVNCATRLLVRLAERLAEAPVPVAPPAALEARDAALEARLDADEATLLAREASEEATEAALAACEDAALAALARADEAASEALEWRDEAAGTAEAAWDQAEARMLEAAYWVLDTAEALGCVRVGYEGGVDRDFRVLRGSETGDDGNGEEGETHFD